MNATESHAHTILRRDPHDLPVLGAGVPISLRLVIDVLADPALPESLGPNLMTWVLTYFDAHPTERTSQNIAALAAVTVTHPHWTDATTASRLLVDAAAG